jgi:drug/metabolite transporter (DMT)-like permease
MAGGSTMLMWSVQYTSATNVALFSASQPMVTALMTWVILKDVPTRLQLSGMVAALVGIAVMATRMDIRVLLDLTFNLGDLFVLVAVLFYSLYSVNLHRWFADVSPFLMMYLTVLGGIIILIPFYGYELQSLGGFYPSIEVCVAIVFMATIPTIVATTMWNVSVGVVGANRASIFLSLLPIFGIGLAVSFLGEALLNYHFVGAFLICAGIAAVVWPQDDL